MPLEPKPSKQKKRKFPTPNPFRFGPRTGKRFEEKHLPPLAKETFGRISQIYGISIQQLLPWRHGAIRGLKGWSKNRALISFMALIGVSVYHPQIHSISTPRLHPMRVLNLKRALAGTKTSRMQQQLLDSVLRLLNASTPFHPLDKSFRQAGSLPIRNITHPKLLRTRLVGQKTEQAMDTQKEVNNFYLEYGIDGLLSLAAEMNQIPNFSALKSFRSRVAKDELLDHNGFTTKGLEWFKEKVPKNIITANLSSMEEARNTAL